MFFCMVLRMPKADRKSPLKAVSKEPMGCQDIQGLVTPFTPVKPPYSQEEGAFCRRIYRSNCEPTDHPFLTMYHSEQSHLMGPFKIRLVENHSIIVSENQQGATRFCAMSVDIASRILNPWENTFCKWLSGLPIVDQPASLLSIQGLVNVPSWGF